MKKTHTVRLFSAVLLVLVLSETLSACPVCYGASDSPMADGVNAAILVLLGITGSVLIAFAAFFVYLRKRSRITLDENVDFPSLN